MPLDVTRLLLDSGQVRVNRFIDENIVRFSEEEVLQPTQQLAWSEGLSENAIQGMKIEKIGFMKVIMTWEYLGPNDIPLHKFIEEDTKPHIIRAIGKMFGGADMLRWYDAGRKPIFRPMVRHPGTTGKHIMKRGWEIGKPKLIKRITHEVNNYLEVNRFG